MPLTLAGKCEPDKETIQELHSSGFDNFEMYLNTNILSNNTVSEIVTVCKSSPGSFVSVHTPHVDLSENTHQAYFRKTDKIADKLDAVLIIDSNPTSTRSIQSIYPPEEVLSSKSGYENDPGFGSFYLERNHLERDIPLVIDTAHLYMSEKNYLSFIEMALQKYQSLIPAMHLAEGHRTQDGLPFGQGSVNLKRILELLVKYDYSNPITLETSQETQPDALKFAQETLNNI